MQTAASSSFLDHTVWRYGHGAAQTKCPLKQPSVLIPINHWCECVVAGGEGDLKAILLWYRTGENIFETEDWLRRTSKESDLFDVWTYILDADKCWIEGDRLYTRWTVRLSRHLPQSRWKSRLGQNHPNTNDPPPHVAGYSILLLVKITQQLILSVQGLSCLHQCHCARIRSGDVNMSGQVLWPDKSFRTGDRTWWTAWHWAI